MWASNSTLLSPLYMRSQHFGHRTWWTMCHRLWGPQERGLQGTILWIVLFCSSASRPSPSPAVRVMKEKVPWEQARDGMNCSGRADLELNTVQGLWCLFSFWRLLTLSAHPSHHSHCLPLRNWFKIHSLLWSEKQRPLFQLQSQLFTPLPLLTALLLLLLHALPPPSPELFCLLICTSATCPPPPPRNLLQLLPPHFSLAKTFFLFCCYNCLWAGSQPEDLTLLKHAWDLPLTSVEPDFPWKVLRISH